MLEPITHNPASDMNPEWSLDGASALFLSDRGAVRGLWQMPMARRRARLLVQLAADTDWVRLSPDGQHLAYQTKGKDAAINVWLADLKGNQRRQLTFDRELMGFSTWSPDGRQLVVEARRGRDTWAYLVPAEGGQPRPLLTGHAKYYPNSWSAVGNRIAYASNEGGNWNLWWIDPVRNRRQQLTRYVFPHSEGYVRYPAWSPHADALVFEKNESRSDLWMLQRASEPKKPS